MAFHAKYGGKTVADAAITPALQARGLYRSLSTDPYCIVQWAAQSDIHWGRWAAGLDSHSDGELLIRSEVSSTGAHKHGNGVLPISRGSNPLLVSCFRIHYALCRKDCLVDVMQHMADAAQVRLQTDASLSNQERQALRVVKLAAVPSIGIPASLCPECQLARITARFGGTTPSVSDPMLVLKEPATNNALGVHIVPLSTLLPLLKRLADGRPSDTCPHTEASSTSADTTIGYVVQHYIPNPVLLEGRKFHLRVNMVAVGALDVFMHHDLICHVACERLHAAPTSEDMFRLQHVTNHCVQRSHPDYDASHTLLLTELSRRMFRADETLAVAWEQTIVRRIYSLAKQLFQFVMFEKRPCGRRYGFVPTRNAFDLFGFDFLLSVPSDEDPKDGAWPVLIEVNAGPALEGLASPKLCKQVVEDIAKLVVDPLLEAAGEAYLGGASERACFTRIFSHRFAEDDGEHPWYSRDLIAFVRQTLANKHLLTATETDSV